MDLDSLLLLEHRLIAEARGENRHAACRGHNGPAHAHGYHPARAQRSRASDRCTLALTRQHVMLRIKGIAGRTRGVASCATGYLRASPE